MAATKKHVFNLFLEGWPINVLAERYGFGANRIAWVESALRKYMGKGGK